MNPRTVVLDVGLATALQARGLPRMTPVDDWILTRPDEVAAAHAAFVAAGAELVLAGTFQTLPSRRADWAEVADRAVAIALSAAGSAQVWASIGPVASAEELGRLAARCVAAGAEGIALETFTDPAACRAAVIAVRAVTTVPIAACLCPRADGALWAGGDPAPALRSLVEAGADHVGFNCGTGPESVERAVERAPLADWAKPNAGDSAPDAIVAALHRLSERVRYVGGCCGVGADVLAAFTRDRRA